MISSTLIKSIQDVMRQDDGVDGDAQRLSSSCGWCSSRFWTTPSKSSN